MERALNIMVAVFGVAMVAGLIALIQQAHALGTHVEQIRSEEIARMAEIVRAETDALRVRIDNLYADAEGGAP